ncbi:excinuclease ABC subunit C [Salinirussus salinus]|uniref:excinuclease ABC subunit C n=1 Tax=Salinirussus salinus TaxID=1198300 RepID=UPI00135A30D7|nr:excinuclease ABC subunit C [Salinirussus salinus]
MDREAVLERAAGLPDEPGVYQFLAGDRVLYVGKAVSVRDRVRSYAEPRSERIARMVAEAERIEPAVTDTETQALLLEANLIKRHRPRYNVRLKDDKSYPLVQLTDHDAPRIEVTRDPEEGATVFGPFTDKGRVETVVKALREVYGVRGCSDHKYRNRDRPCLDYEVGLCTAPCTGEISGEDYLADVEAVERFLEGETGVLAGPLRREMEGAAQDQAYERAANLRDRLAAVESFHGEGGGAVAARESEGRTVDVLGVSLEGSGATVARLRAEDGKLVERDRYPLDAPESAGAADVLGAFITQYYAERELPAAVLCPEYPRASDDAEKAGDGAGEDIEAWLAGAGTDLRVPGAGREATLVDLATKNARRGHPTRDGTEALAGALGLDAAARVEGFDVSHAQGRAVVGSNVCFVGGEPAKEGYRRKKLAERNDDYANMRALVRWRAERAREGRDDRPDPDLLLVDGGEGQLGAARDALREVGWDVPVVALAKSEERVVTPDGVEDWPDDAPHLHLLQRVRDEAHRFARQYHETVRDEVSTPLDGVPGVGPETRRRLLGRFGSVAGVREASLEELRDVEGVGEQTAARIDDHL